MKKSLAFILTGIVLLIVCEGGIIDVPPIVRTIETIFVIPTLIAMLFIVGGFLTALIYPIIEWVNEYFDRKDDERREKRWRKKKYGAR